jgi:hypothetical protein
MRLPGIPHAHSRGPASSRLIVSVPTGDGALRSSHASSNPSDRSSLSCVAVGGKQQWQPTMVRLARPQPKYELSACTS